MNNDNPSNAGQVDLSDVDSSEVTPLVTPDVSQGVPDTLNRPKPGSTNEPVVPEAPETPVEPQTPETPEATTERLKQTNAQNAKLLHALGVDPLSDLAEQLEQGLITPEMVREHVASKYSPPAPISPEPTKAPTTDPVALAEKELQDAEAAYNKEVEETEGVSIVTNNKLRAADKALNDAKLNKLSRQIADEKQVKQVNENIGAVLSVARDFEEFEGMTPQLQQATDDVSIALTGQIADRKAREMNLDPANLTPSQYQYFATEAQKVLQGVAEHYRELGRKEVREQFNPNPNPNLVPRPNNANTPLPTIVPTGADGNPVPVADPYANASSLNHERLARDFEKKNRAVI